MQFDDSKTKKTLAHLEPSPRAQRAPAANIPLKDFDADAAKRRRFARLEQLAACSLRIQTALIFGLAEIVAALDLELGYNLRERLVTQLLEMREYAGAEEN